jgi:hypothetical protein
MDQAATDVSEKTQKPEHDKDYNYGPKHKFTFGFVFLQGLCVAMRQKH